MLFRSLFLVRPTHGSALDFLQERVGDDAQWLGNALAVEHRYIASLVAQLREEGWDVR